MAQQTINVGTAPNDGTGTPLRTAFQYTNSNFSELYTALGGGSGLPGATTQVIFNDGGTNLAGDAGLVYNKTTDALTIGGNVQAASATITGDLTVDTNSLYVNSSTNNVGLGTLTPSGASGRALEIYGGAGQSRLALKNDTTGSASTDGSQIALVGSQLVIQNREASEITFETNNSERYRLDSTGVATWSNVGGVAGTAMTLNSTGLGVGVVPSAGKFEVQESGTGAGIGGIFASTASGGGNPGFVFRTASTNRWSLSLTGSAGAESIRFYDINNSATRLLIDSSGNVGIGVTPSAWVTGKALQVGTTGTSLWGYADTTYLTQNAAGYPSTSFIYGTTNLAAAYQMQTGVHKWFIAPSGTAGNAITFTQAMTLDASGNLLVGTTSGNNRVQVAGNIGLPNSCIGSFETRGVFSIDVANLFALTGAVWRQCSFLLVYSGVDENLGNPTVLQTVVTLTGLSTYNTISKNDIVGTASLAVSNDTSSGARVTVTVPTGNFGSVYVMLLGGLGATTRPSMTINN